MECETNPRSTRDADGRLEMQMGESSSSVLRTLIDGMPTVAFGFVLTVVSPCMTIHSGRVVIKNVSAASHPFIHMDVFAFSMIGVFASALSSITFRRSLPELARVLEDVPVVFLVSAFASLVSALVREEFRWAAYVLCVIPAIPLLRRLWQSLSGRLGTSVRNLAALVAGWFHGGEDSVQRGDGCGCDSV